MRSRTLRRCATLLLAGLGMATRADAQVRALVAEVAYQSPGLVAPVILVSSSSASGRHTWTGGLIGGTLSAEWLRTWNPTLATIVSAELTPSNSHSSNYIYIDGVRDPALRFTDRTARLVAGLRLASGPAWRFDLRAIGLSEAVSGLADTAVAARWHAPYAGLGIEARYRHLVAADALGDQFDGVSAFAGVEGFAGTRPWLRSQLSLGAGRRLGRVTLRGRAWALLGHNLDIVNRHLVGGSWELGDGPVLYGYHYAQFRVDRAVVLGGGADLRLAGDWQLGVRVGFMSSPTRTTYGEAVTVSTLWNGIGLHVGVGLPRATLFHRETDKPMLFAWLTAVAL